MKRLRVRRTVLVFATLIAVAFGILSSTDAWHIEQTETSPAQQNVTTASGDVVTALNALEVKGRAPKTEYQRTQFGSGWAIQGGCDTRNIILARDLQNTSIDEKCRVTSGTLIDPYTGTTIQFVRGEQTSQAVQIDHVVALSNAWQTGAQSLTEERRSAFANDPLNLLAVDGKANQEKSAGDAATWLPGNKAFRCQYVARQVAVKRHYNLWVTPAEKEAILRTLTQCPGQQLPA